jgi:Protein of unknown function DUF262/Protein of unknown function (DUF1524)
MRNQRRTIRKIVDVLNNPEEDGGFWLPNIQRSFVWSEEQICKLFDSILREYPISTLLVWKTISAMRRRKFIENWRETLRLSDFYVPQNNKRKCLVLDGQQRLQSLFIGLRGSYEGRELYLDILSGNVAAPDDIKYTFKFLNSEATFPWIKFKDLVFSNSDPVTAAEEVAGRSNQELTVDQRKKISRHVGLIFKTFQADEGIVYQELDSIDNPSLYTEDDVVEVFIRANSGGTKLGKSDLLFSLLQANWEFAGEEMEDLLESLNQHGFAFDRDFALKTSLTLLDQGARYEVEKFRQPGVREDVQAKWDDISQSIMDVIDFVYEKTFIHCDKALSSYLVLIPLIYTRYHFRDGWKDAKDVDTYLLRCLLTGAFSGQSDNLIDRLTPIAREAKGFDLRKSFDVMRSQGRSLELTESQLWQMGYGSKAIHLLFNLWYRDFNYTPAYDDNLPQVDHIFPKSLLKTVKMINPATGRKDLLKYHEADRNQLANCMLLTREENGAGGKWDIPPDEWFAGKPSEYLAKHLIPSDPELWRLDRFDDFIEARKKRIREKFNYLLVPMASSGASNQANPTH